MHPPDECRTYAAIAVANGLKQAIATNVAAQSYSAATLDGGLANPGPAVFVLPMTVSVTTSAMAATYNTTDPIVFTGTNPDGDAATVSLMLLAAGGGETIVATTGLLTVTTIDVPAQLGGAGTFTFGVRDIMPGSKAAIVQFVAEADGDVLVGWVNGHTDTVTVAKDMPETQLVDTIFGTAATTALPLRVKFDRG
jgi:hypothetical protein